MRPSQKHANKRDIKFELVQLSDAKYRTFSSGLLPGTENIIGVRIPILRNLAKEIANGDWQTYLKEATDDSFEEIMLQGLVISYAKGNPEQIIPALRYFIPKIDNWSVCDSVAMGLKIAEKYPDTFWKFALQHIDSDREFFIRFGVVMLLSHYVDEKHIDSVLNILDKIPSEEHYVKMAVAWAVSVCYVKFPEKSHAYLLNCHLNDDTYNKSIQKIIESYRVDDEAKNNLRNMRRK